MLNDDNVDKTQNIVVWQWCKKTNSNTESLYNLSDDSWIPYLYEQNNIIEDAFANNNKKVEIILPFDNSRRTISFNSGSRIVISLRLEVKKANLCFIILNLDHLTF